MKFDLKTSTTLQDYNESLSFMRASVASVREGSPPLLWFLEYPPLFTEGMGSRQHALKTSFPLITTDRGGKITYHGPGQRVVYIILDLHPFGKDAKLYVYFLEEWIIETLSRLGIKGERFSGFPGVWVKTEDGPQKIAALGVRIQKWVTSHGFSLNVAPDLGHYKDIVPCGIMNHGITSIQRLGVSASMGSIDALLLETFPIVFERIMKESVDGYCKT